LAGHFRTGAVCVRKRSRILRLARYLADNFILSPIARSAAAEHGDNNDRRTE
jgi:hypothetical protein